MSSKSASKRASAARRASRARSVLDFIDPALDAMFSPTLTSQLTADLLGLDAANAADAPFKAVRIAMMLYGFNWSASALLMDEDARLKELERLMDGLPLHWIDPGEWRLSKV